MKKVQSLLTVACRWWWVRLAWYSLVVAGFVRLLASVTAAAPPPTPFQIMVAASLEQSVYDSGLGYLYGLGDLLITHNLVWLPVLALLVAVGNRLTVRYSGQVGRKVEQGALTVLRLWLSAIAVLFAPLCLFWLYGGRPDLVAEVLVVILIALWVSVLGRRRQPADLVVETPTLSPSDGDELKLDPASPWLKVEHSSFHK